MSIVVGGSSSNSGSGSSSSSGLNATPIENQGKIATTGTAVHLLSASTPTAQGVGITALSTNAAPLVVGPSGVTNAADGTGNGQVVYPGQTYSFNVTDASLLWVNGTAGDGWSFDL